MGSWQSCDAGGTYQLERGEIGRVTVTYEVINVNGFMRSAIAQVSAFQLTTEEGTHQCGKMVPNDLECHDQLPSFVARTLNLACSSKATDEVSTQHNSFRRE